MAFKIANSRPKKMQKRIAAFDDTGEDDSSLASSSKEATAALGASAQTWIDKGSTYAQAGDPAAALRCWDQAALIQPSNARVHEMRAQVLNDLNRTFEAVQAALQAVILNPEWPEAHITLARVQLNLGEPQLALQSYQTAAKLQPGHPDLAQELPAAQMYAKMHKQQPAGTRAHVTGPPSSRAAAASGAAGNDVDDVHDSVEGEPAGLRDDQQAAAAPVAAADAAEDSGAALAAAAEESAAPEQPYAVAGNMEEKPLSKQQQLHKPQE